MSGLSNCNAWIIYDGIIVMRAASQQATPEYFPSQGFAVGFKRSALIRGWPVCILIGLALTLPVLCPCGINITNESREAEIRQIFVGSLVLFGGSSMSRLKDTGYLREDYSSDRGFPLWRFWASLSGCIKRTRCNRAAAAPTEVIVHVNMN